MANEYGSPVEQERTDSKTVSYKQTLGIAVSRPALLHLKESTFFQSYIVDEKRWVFLFRRQCYPEPGIE
ncbi:hypothetical protein [Niabella sp.]|uniref:hypothetical protein n=1 Tax=Niabella sp. TaxID=1962976 RepID=UPI00261654D5|nr:hypothetical protein [Niabella sp.]